MVRVLSLQFNFECNAHTHNGLIRHRIKKPNAIRIPWIEYLLIAIFLGFSGDNESVDELLPNAMSLS